MLLEPLTVLGENTPVVLIQNFLASAGRRIDGDLLGKKENQLFAPELSILHGRPIAVEPLIAGDGSPGLRFTPLICHGFVGGQFVTIVGVHRPADLRPCGFVQGVEEMPDGFIEPVEGMFARVPKIGHIKHKALSDEPVFIEIVPDNEVVRKPAVRSLHG